MAARDPFDFVGDGEVGVVCVHGFTGSPFEMRYLGEQLARAGHTVSGLQLPGHGTSVAELDGMRWEDWAAAVEREVDTMSARSRRVVVVGQSLGGLLALHLAARRPDLAAVVSLRGPALARRPGWPGRALADRPARRPPDPADPQARRLGCPRCTGARRQPELPGVPDPRARPAARVHADRRRRALPQITAPVLVLHARQDHTAPVACAARIAERARARRLRILPRSYHLIAIDVERDIVAAEVIAFLARHATRSLGDSSCVM